MKSEHFVGVLCPVAIVNTQNSWQMQRAGSTDAGRGPTRDPELGKAWKPRSPACGTRQARIWPVVINVASSLKSAFLEGGSDLPVAPNAIGAGGSKSLTHIYNLCSFLDFCAC